MIQHLYYLTALITVIKATTNQAILFSAVWRLFNKFSLAEVAGNWNCEFWPASVKILTLASYSLVKHCGMLKCVIEVWQGHVEGWAEDGPKHCIMSCTCAAYIHLKTLIYFHNLAGTQFEVDTKRWINFHQWYPYEWMDKWKIVERNNNIFCIFLRI